MELRSMNKPAACLAAVALLLFTPVATALAGDVVVIANQDVAASIDAGALKNIFLGKSTKVDGAKVSFAVLEGGPAHEAFLSHHVGKSASQFTSFWRKQAFTGKGSLPTAFASPAEMVAWVAGTPGAVGYVPAGTDTGAAAVLVVQ